MKRRYDDQLFARCRKADRRKAERAARIKKQDLSEFIRIAVDGAADAILWENDDKRLTSGGK